MIKVVFVTRSELAYDSAPSSRLFQIAKVLNEKGFSTTIIGGKTSKKVDIPNSKVIAVKPMLTVPIIGWGIIFRLQLLIQVVQQLLARDTDSVVVRDHLLAVLIAPFTRLFGRKMISDFHGYRYREQIEEGMKFKPKIIRLIEFLSLRFSDYIIAVSEGVYNQLPGNFQKKAIILPNGVDLDIFKEEFGEETKLSLLRKYRIPKDKKIVGFIGHWRKWFNLNDLFDSSRYLDDDTLIVTAGEYYDYAKLKHLKPEDMKKILFLGRIPHRDVIILLKEVLDICVVPYDKKWSTSNILNFFSARKVKEYLAAGKPIIMSNVEGREEFLKENKNMLLYEPGNPKDLADKIKIVLTNKKLCREISKNNLSLSKEFSWEKVIEKSRFVDMLRGITNLQ